MSNAIRSQNTASGANALEANTSGSNDTANGFDALELNIAGDNNTANGAGALFGNTYGSNNTANGLEALEFNTTGGNTANGMLALNNNTTGNNNIAIGFSAAINVAPGNSNNIHIGNEGLSADGAAANSGVIRIGTPGTQTSAYIAGIYNGTPSTPNLPVCVDANGTLGTTGCSSTPSSRRFKDQISDMGDSSSKLFQLRPVTFLYKPQYDAGSHELQYGLIAEEVAKLYPEMVGYDKEGQPSSIKYQLLTPMLLNEVQKQAARDRQQTEEIRSLEDRLAAVEALLSANTSGGAPPLAPADH
jgi:hypothetical protein